MKRKNVAVVLAGGVGQRFQTELPKQFAKAAGKTIIEHTITAFEENGLIDEIAVVMHPNYMQNLENMVMTNNWKKVKKILNGGDERYLSSLAAIRAYEGEAQPVNLIFHDSVRPLVSNSIIIEVVEGLERFSAIDVAIPATDTVIQIDRETKTIVNVPDRSTIYNGQTPQAFHLEVIASAYEKALQDPEFKTTDDCGVVKKYLPQVPVHNIDGRRKNIKLTHIEDLYLTDKLFQLNSEQADETADFSQMQGKCLMVFGGNSGIGAEICRIAEENGAKVYSFSRSTTGTDISKMEDVRAAFDQVSEREGRIDYVVVSAAILKKEPFHQMDLESIDTMIDINYRGMIYVSQCAYPYLKESHGQLLHFTSSSYTLGRPFYSLYSSSKAAVVNFVQALSQEWSNDQIRVNCINPERTKTAMRVKNFGIEDDSTLLKADKVARASIATLLGKHSGLVIDVRR
ncbi:MAG: bifunctional cytidylyltransferase/SDR family oxidoreductase [Oscillospiraceae bacterium]|nr:bifunctional cytidylyltransferase/SDR family oxidoreductase [Oscillospiraceae bacterium]